MKFFDFVSNRNDPKKYITIDSRVTIFYNNTLIEGIVNLITRKGISIITNTSTYGKQIFVKWDKIFSIEK